MSGIEDLMALAIVRRLLLELGYELRPEHPGTDIGPLELWIHEPRPELQGRTPRAVIFESHGQAQVRDCLLTLIEGSTNRPSK